jgi:hypothetical protein
MQNHTSDLALGADALPRADSVLDGGVGVSLVLRVLRCPLPGREVGSRTWFEARHASSKQRPHSGLGRFSSCTKIILV